VYEAYKTAHATLSPATLGVSFVKQSIVFKICTRTTKIPRTIVGRKVLLRTSPNRTSIFSRPLRIWLNLSLTSRVKIEKYHADLQDDLCDDCARLSSTGTLDS
jgi:hypothetical protein